MACQVSSQVGARRSNLSHVSGRIRNPFAAVVRHLFEHQEQTSRRQITKQTLLANQFRVIKTVKAERNVMDPTFWATIGSVIVAVAAVLFAYVGVKRQLKQNYAIVGAQSAIEWRAQVFDLHDRGLKPEEIRYIMHLERGGEEYERQNGPIDDVVRNVPRKP